MTEGARKNSLKKNKDRWIIYYIQQAGNYIESFIKLLEVLGDFNLQRNLNKQKKKKKQSQNSKKT